MKPIHHSKLKKGDLIYVESMLLNFNGNPIYFGLLEVLYAGPVGFTATDGKSYQHYSGIGIWEHFFLIERGYFL